MSRRTVIAGLVILALIGASIAAYPRLTSRRTAVRYITRPVVYADISSTVTETGTVNPVDVVQVGTQVSGTIAVLNVDYNSRVKKGQVLALLDQTSFQAASAQAGATYQAAQATASASQSAIAQAQASAQAAQANVSAAQSNLDKAKAQSALSQLTVKRDRQLLTLGYIPQSQLDTDQTTAQADLEAVRAAQDAVAVAQAQSQSARMQVTAAQSQAAAAQHQAGASAAQVQQAQYNLSRTVITSPVDGIVMARNVSVGQTVAASLQTPTLFTIATNLTDMQVDTSVDEADVGNVRQGEAAQITVTAYPNVTFQGTVQQVRVNPTVVQNVVTYDGVIAVHDSSGRLLPGMTAQVVIDTGTHTHVLAVPTSALLFRPLAQRRAPSASPVGPGGPGGFGAPATTGGPAVSAPVAGAPGSRVTVWVLRNNRPAPVSAVIGLSDSRNVEITSGNLKEGDPMIIAQVQGGRGAQGGGQGGPGGGGAPGPGGGGG